MKTKSIVLGLLFVAIAGAAAYLFIVNLRGPEAQLPNTAESAQTYLCEKCGQRQDLTPRQLDEAIRQTQRSGVKPPESEMSVRKMMILQCPSCKEPAVVLSRPCPQCGSPFLGTTTDGQSHTVCPACAKAQPPGAKSKS